MINDGDLEPLPPTKAQREEPISTYIQGGPKKKGQCMDMA